MKKVYIIFALLLSLFIFSSCKKEDASLKLVEALNKINLPEETTFDLNLVKEVDGFNVVWSSNNVETISNEGIVKQSINDVTVTLTASISKDNITKEKEFTVVVKKLNVEQLIKDVLSQIVLPSEVSDDIDLPTSINNISISWSTSNKSLITTKGKVNKGPVDTGVVLKATINIYNTTLSKDFEITVLKDNRYDYINSAIDSVKLPSETSENITLPTLVDNVSIAWSSSRALYLSNSGIITRSSEDKTVTLTATYQYEELKVQKYYDIVIKGWTDLEKVQMVIEKIEFDENLKTDLILSTFLGYNTVSTWVSSNTNVLTNEGKYTYDENISTITLTVTVTLGSESMTKEFTFNLMPKEEMAKEHLIINRANEFDNSKFNNVVLNNGKLVLADGFTQGFYESGVIETKEFTSLVASWAAISSKTSTVELFVKARVNGVWSDYITYGAFGLGLQNGSKNQTNSLIKLSTDEVMVLNGIKADAIMFKAVLTTTGNDTPELSLVAFALEIPGYTYIVETESLPKSVIHSVPKLCQRVVPTIGGSICSPTSSTMLLKYKGENFTQYDSEYEHRYIAGLFRDYGHNIYGNWVYNTVGMGAYGYDAYVARFYSVNELVKHLATVGPVALSVKGQMNSDKKNYYTDGHLLVAIGYEYGENGDLTIVCNDPNVDSVECRYSLSVINDTWRMIAYVIE